MASRGDEGGSGEADRSGGQQGGCPFPPIRGRRWRRWLRSPAASSEASEPSATDGPSDERQLRHDGRHGLLPHDDLEVLAGLRAAAHVAEGDALAERRAQGPRGDLAGAGALPLDGVAVPRDALVLHEADELVGRRVVLLRKEARLAEEVAAPVHRPLQAGLDGGAAALELVAGEAVALLQPQGVAGAEADGLDAQGGAGLQQVVPDAAGAVGGGGEADAPLPGVAGAAGP